MIDRTDQYLLHYSMYEVLMRLFNSASDNEYDNTERRLGPHSKRRFLSNLKRKIKSISSSQLGMITV